MVDELGNKHSDAQVQIQSNTAKCLEEMNIEKDNHEQLLLECKSTEQELQGT